jgi:hypothetical protein
MDMPSGLSKGQIKIFRASGHTIEVLDLENDGQARQAQRLAA